MLTVMKTKTKKITFTEICRSDKLCPPESSLETAAKSVL
jgi:hypothetical protein